jgi:hypothetical protein
VRACLPLLLLGFVLLPLACGPGEATDLPGDQDSGTAAGDSGTPAPPPGDDGGNTPFPDAGPPPDGGTAPPPEDAGTAAPDAGQAPADAGTPDAGASLRIAVLSDLNGSYGSTTYEASVHNAVSALTSSVKPDLVLISGDMVAGQQAGLNYAAMWQGFHAAVTTPLTQAGIPVAPAPGNHDASAYAGFEAERDEYRAQWEPSRRPAVTMVDGSNFPFRYSFTFKGAFFVALDATTVGALPSAQKTWVQQQLDGAAGYSVKIVYGHVPIRPTAVGRETQVMGDVAFEAMLKARGALFVGGHHHGYYPGVSNGLRHVVTPCIGAGPRTLIGTSSTSARGFVVIDVAGGAISSVEARTGTSSGFNATISRASLPAEIRSGSHLLTRDDLAAP